MKPNTPQQLAAEPSSIQPDTHAIIGSILYLLLLLGFFGWQLFDTWIGSHTILVGMGYPLERLNMPMFHLMTYTLIGGALGGIVNGIRSAVIYCTAFDGRYVWKYITAPWMGATLALLVYALIRSTVAVLGDPLLNTDISAPQLLANFAIGALAGYGAKDVFIWLDAQVHKLFKVTEATPDVQGQPAPVAISQVQARDLQVGAVAPIPHQDPAMAGKVVEQAPAPGTPIDRGGTVDLTVAMGKADANGQSG